MKYKAIYEKGMIFTDDYDEDEIANRIHIDNIRKDLRRNHIESPVVLFDEYNRLIQIFNISA